jgi:hypothetical protein
MLNVYNIPHNEIPFLIADAIKLYIIIIKIMTMT